MSKITLKNPTLSSVQSSIGTAKVSVDNHSKSLSTGIKANNDVVSGFLGRSLDDKYRVMSKVLSNLSYSTNALKVTQTSLEGIASTLSDALSVVAQSAGGSKANLDTLNNILQQKLGQVRQQVSTASFDGRDLLSGDLGQDSSLRAAYHNNSVSVRVIPASAAANAGFLAGGTAGTSTITIGALPAAGEKINLAGVEFTAVTGVPASENEFQIGTTVADTASNLASAIKNHSADSLQSYNVNVAAGVITIAQNSASSKGIDLAGSANMAVAVTTPSVSGGIDTSGIKDIEGFIGAVPTANFTVVQQVTGATAKAIAAAAGNVTLPAAVAHIGDSVGVFKVEIAGKTFQGALFQPNGGNLHDAELRMVNAESGEYFTIKGDTAYAGDVTTAGNTTAVATALNTLVHGTTFAQTKTLKINTGGGDVVRNGDVIASVKGMTASFTSTNFDGLSVEDFTIGTSANAGNVLFTATIGGKDYVADVATAGLQQGSKIDLTNGVTGDTLTINIGQGGLTKLSDVANHEAIGKAIKGALQNAGNGLDVRIGLGFEDQFTVQIGSLDDQSLYRDNQGKFVGSLDLTSEQGSKVAHEVISNALTRVRKEQASISAQQEVLQQVTSSMQAANEVTKGAADSYLSTDLLEASSGLSESVKVISAAVAALQAGARISEVATQIVQQAAQ